MRKKTRPALDVAAVTEAWAKFAEQEKIWTDKELCEVGWMNRRALEKQFHLCDRAVKKMIKQGKLESKQFKLLSGGQVRLYTYVRPKI